MACKAGGQYAWQQKWCARACAGVGSLTRSWPSCWQPLICYGLVCWGQRLCRRRGPSGALHAFHANGQARMGRTQIPENRAAWMCPNPDPPACQHSTSRAVSGPGWLCPGPEWGVQQIWRPTMRKLTRACGKRLLAPLQANAVCHILTWAGSISLGSFCIRFWQSQACAARNGSERGTPATAAEAATAPTMMPARAPVGRPLDFLQPQSASGFTAQPWRHAHSGFHPSLVWCDVLPGQCRVYHLTPAGKPKCRASKCWLSQKAWTFVQSPSQSSWCPSRHAVTPALAHGCSLQYPSCWVSRWQQPTGWPSLAISTCSLQQAWAVGWEWQHMWAAAMGAADEELLARMACAWSPISMSATWSNPISQLLRTCRAAPVGSSHGGGRGGVAGQDGLCLAQQGLRRHALAAQQRGRIHCQPCRCQPCSQGARACSAPQHLHPAQLCESSSCLRICMWFPAAAPDTALWDEPMHARPHVHLSTSTPHGSVKRAHAWACLLEHHMATGGEYPHVHLHVRPSTYTPHSSVSEARARALARDSQHLHLAWLCGRGPCMCICMESAFPAPAPHTALCVHALLAQGWTTNQACTCDLCMGVPGWSWCRISLKRSLQARLLCPASRTRHSSQAPDRTP